VLIQPGGNTVVTVIGADGNLYLNWESATNSVWSGWQNLGAAGGGFWSTPAMVEQQNGNTVLVAVGLDHNAYVNWQMTNGSWAGWGTLASAGGGFTTSPAVLVQPSGNTVVIAVGTDGNLYLNLQNASTEAWSGWVNLGQAGSGFTTPAIIEQHNGNTVLVDIGADKNVYFDWQKTDGTWAGWGGLGDAGGGFISMVSISGQVTTGGSRLSGVAVSLTGNTAAGTSASQTTNTGSNGNYSFSVPAGGVYTITPSLPGYAFGPEWQKFSDVSGNQTANFAAVTSSSGSGGNGSGGGGGSGGSGSGETGGYDISGNWYQASTFAGTWQLTENGTYVSGTATSTAGGNCGVITWQVTGELISSTDGTYSLTATNPSAATDNCGNESASMQVEQLTLASGNQTGYSIDQSVFSTGPVSGASSWSRSGSSSPIAISGSPGIPLNGYSDYQITVGSFPVTVNVTTTTGSGSVEFANNSYTSITISQSQTLRLLGNSVSSTAGNILITATASSDPAKVLAQLKVSVVSVSLNLRNSGSVSPDNTAAQRSSGAYGSNLGPHVIPGVLGQGPYCAEIVEYVGTVTPSNYPGVIPFYRTKNTALFEGQTRYQTQSGNDPIDPGVTVTTPTTQGHVFDFDAPGQYPAAGSGHESEIWRARQNYTEMALLDALPKGSSGSTILATINTFARTSCTGPSSAPQFSSNVNIPGDNTSGVGSTNLTWNLQ
jgi:hypothetical protein